MEDDAIDIFRNGSDDRNFWEIYPSIVVGKPCGQWAEDLPSALQSQGYSSYLKKVELLSIALKCRGSCAKSGFSSS